MTEPKLKSEKLSETTKAYLAEVYVNLKYGREKDISNKYIQKGLLSEEDAITLYALHRDMLYTKNEERFSNEYIQGTPDIIPPTEVIDTKCSWDIFTFFATKSKPLNKDYYWQLQGYMALTDKPIAKLAYCLVNTPESIIEQEQRKLLYSMGVSQFDDTYLEGCEKIRKQSIFDDIPMIERINEITIERSDADIERLYARIKECRQWIEDNFLTSRVVIAGELLNKQ